MKSACDGCSTAPCIENAPEYFMGNVFLTPPMYVFLNDVRSCVSFGTGDTSAALINVTWVFWILCEITPYNNTVLFSVVKLSLVGLYSLKCIHSGLPLTSINLNAWHTTKVNSFDWILICMDAVWNFMRILLPEYETQTQQRVPVV